MNIFLQTLWENPVYYFCWVVAVLFSATLHDFVHTKVIERCHEEFAMIRGTYTLNPFCTFSTPSLICLFLFGIIWGIPPVRTDMLIRNKNGYTIHLAGPITNLLLAIAASFLTSLLLLCAKTTFVPPGMEYFLFFLSLFAQANCLLAVLNMIPIPGLDGWGLLETASELFRNMDFRRKNIISFAAILLLWATPVARAFYTVQNVLYALINLPFLKCLNMF